MTINIQILAMTCIAILYFILPAYFSNGAGLVFGGGTPVDFGKSDKNGNRWIGDGVTWRGLIAGTIIGTITGIAFGVILFSIFKIIWFISSSILSVTGNKVRQQSP